MSKRLNQAAETEETPKRMKYAISAIVELGKTVTEYEKNIVFMHKGSKILFWPYTGWASGRTIKDGRGLKT